MPALFTRPAAIQPVLDALHDDPSQDVCRSVANHLNDVSRIDRAPAVATASRWTADGQVSLVVRHGLRTLVKQGAPDALRLLGFGLPGALLVDGPRLAADAVAPGQALEFSITVTSTGPASVKAAIDYVVHYRKASGTLSPRV